MKDIDNYLMKTLKICDVCCLIFIFSIMSIIMGKLYCVTLVWY